MNAFWGLLGFNGLVLLVNRVQVARGDRVMTLKRNQAKPPAPKEAGK